MKKLTEARIHQIVGENIRKMLKEGHSYEIKAHYDRLMNAIDEFENVLIENGYDITHDECGEMFKSLMNAQKKVNDYFRHPEGNGYQKVWDNVGF